MWTEIEDKFLEASHSSMPVIDIANYIGKHPKTVQRRIEVKGLEFSAFVCSESKKNTEIETFVIENYGKIPTRDILNELDISIGRLNSIRAKYNLKSSIGTKGYSWGLQVKIKEYLSASNGVESADDIAAKFGVSRSYVVTLARSVNVLITGIGSKKICMHKIRGVTRTLESLQLSVSVKEGNELPEDVTEDKVKIRTIKWVLRQLGIPFSTTPPKTL